MADAFVPDADRAEQDMPAVPLDAVDDEPTIGLEVPEADALEQARSAAVPDEDEALG